MIPNRDYKIILQVNSRFKPKPPVESDDAKRVGGKQKKIVTLHQDNPETIRLSRVGSFNVRTAPSVPCAPHILTPDVIHYDHVTEAKKGSKGIKTGTQDGESVGEDDLDMIETAGMSVVDKLEFFKKKQARKVGSKLPKGTKRYDICVCRYVCIIICLICLFLYNLPISLM